MRILVVRPPVLFFLLLFICPAAISAATGEIVINSGYLSRPRLGPSPNFSFGNAAQGFVVSNGGYNRGDGVGGYAICAPCRAGATINVNGQFVGGSTLGYGSAVAGGVKYDRVYFEYGNLVFNSPTFILPFDTSPTVTIKVPFIMTGNMGLAHNYDQSAFFRTVVRGQGTATVVFDNYFTAIHGWLYEFRGITYHFKPSSKRSHGRKTESEQ